MGALDLGDLDAVRPAQVGSNKGVGDGDVSGAAPTAGVDVHVQTGVLTADRVGDSAIASSKEEGNLYL